MILTWLAGKPSNEVFELQELIDHLNKSLENLKKFEKGHLKNAMRLEKIEIECRADNKYGASYWMKRKVKHQQLAQRFRDLQIPVLEKLIFWEKVKKEVIKVLQNEDFTAKKSTNVFIYFCLFLLILTYFVSF